MNKEDIKPGDLVLYTAGYDGLVNPLLRRVTEVRETECYFEKGLPSGKKTCPFSELIPVPTDYKYSKFPIGRT